MTKKHYELIAATMKICKPKLVLMSPASREQIKQWEICVNHLSEMFIQDNPRFDESKFLKACGL